MPNPGLERCRASIAHHSKSFSLASRLLPGRTADDAAIVYAWCRRVDDAVDDRQPADQPVALEGLRSELRSIYAGEPQDVPELAAFQQVVQRCAIPWGYAEELLEGMAMDCRGTRYRTMDDLLLYCHRVAGVVGLMMCHVMGLRERTALRHAAHLGIAMQLTNICRDVLEDWERGRLYVPDELLHPYGDPDLADRLGEPFPAEQVGPMAISVAHLLDAADEYYRSGDQGLRALSWRCALAVRAARQIYSAIGRRVRAQDCDVTRGRAYVDRETKFGLVVGALGRTLSEAPGRLLRRDTTAIDLDAVAELRFPEDVLPAGGPQC